MIFRIKRSIMRQISRKEKPLFLVRDSAYQPVCLVF